jgi:hypothetical protein
MLKAPHRQTCSRHYISCLFTLAVEGNIDNDNEVFVQLSVMHAAPDRQMPYIISSLTVYSSHGGRSYMSSTYRTTAV